MHKEGVEYTEYEDDLVRQTNMIVDMTIFAPPVSWSNQLYLSIMILPLRSQNKITEERPLLIPNMIIRTSKI